MAYIEDLLERMWNKTEVKDDCWIYTGSLSHNGYGNVSVHDKTERVHRVSWMIYKGPIPKGLIICHNCDNPACWNPEHLFSGTSLDNSTDSKNKGRTNGGRKPVLYLSQRQTRRKYLYDLQLRRVGKV